MKMKKIYTVAALGLGLLIAFVIGQTLVFPFREKSIMENGGGSNEASVEDETVVSIEAWENQENTNDNPWGTTAGIIDTEKGKKAIFLTPGTGVKIKYHANKDAQFIFVYYIHPWVAEMSDGLNFAVEVNDKIIENIEIKSDDVGKEREKKIDLSEYEGENVIIEIRNLLQDGKELDGDWLVIEER